MKIMPPSSIQQPIIKNQYRIFRRSCFSKNKEPIEIKNEFIRLNFEYRKFGMIETFLFETQKLTDRLIKSGKLNIANILINELGKIYFKIGNIELAEKNIKESLRISTLFNDTLHMLARFTDLEKIYRLTNNKYELIKTLKLKKDCAKEIIKDYENSTRNFRSLIKTPTSLESVKIQLAYTYNDLADLLMYKKPKDSIKMLEKALEIYTEIGSDNEAKYIKKKILTIKAKLENKKLL